MYCRGCKQDKPEEAFGISDKQTCRACKNTYMKTYNKMYWLRTKERQKQHYLVKGKVAHATYNHKKRAEEHGVPYERVNLLRLYERDEGICQVCKQPVEWKDASHDLIVPFAKGGPSTWANS